MAFFYKSPLASTDAGLSALVEALGMDKTVGSAGEVKAKELQARVSAAPGAGLHWGRFAVSLALLVVLFLLAINVTHVKASETLLDCFKVVFASFMAVLGFEASKNSK